MLTILLVPVLENKSKHMRWTNHPLVQTLTKINQRRLTFTHHSYTRPKPNSTRSNHEHLLLLVANSAGIAKYSVEGKLDYLKLTIQQHGQHSDQSVQNIQIHKQTSRSISPIRTQSFQLTSAITKTSSIKRLSTLDPNALGLQ